MDPQYKAQAQEYLQARIAELQDAISKLDADDFHTARELVNSAQANLGSAFYLINQAEGLKEPGPRDYDPDL